MNEKTYYCPGCGKPAELVEDMPVDEYDEGLREIVRTNRLHLECHNDPPCPVINAILELPREVMDPAPKSPPTVHEMYDKDPELIDPLISDVITNILELPGVEEAVLVAALKDNYNIYHLEPDTIGDIPYRFVWDRLMNKE